MIEVFETWFNQFSKAEQVKLLRHIQKNHFDLIEGYPSKPTSRVNKRLLENTIGSTSRSEYSK
jgi:hypothetical protein